MKKIDDVLIDLFNLENDLDKFNNLDHNFDYDSKSIEDKLKASKVNSCLGLIADLKNRISTISNEIVAEGNLSFNKNGRYEVDGIELTSGRDIEFLDSENDWQEDRIEHFNGNYGLYYEKTNDLQGIYARIRKLNY